MVIETWLPFNFFSLKFHHMLACCSRDHSSTDYRTQKIFLSHLNAFLCLSPVPLVRNLSKSSSPLSAAGRTRLRLGNTSTCSYMHFDITKSSSAAGRTRLRLGNTSTCPYMCFDITKSSSTAGRTRRRRLGNTGTCYMHFDICHYQHNQQYHCHWYKRIHVIKIMKCVLHSDILTGWMKRCVLAKKTAISCEFFSQCISFNLESSEKEPHFCNSTFGRAFVFVLIFLFLTELILFFVEGFSK